MRSVPLVAALSAATVLAAPAAAWAHGGAGAAYAGEAGHYEVYAYDAVAAAAPGQLEYRLILLDHANDGPADGARAVVRATLAGGSRSVGPVTARSVANVYYYDLPDPGSSTWTVHLSLDGPLGPATTTYRMHGLSEGAPATSPTPAADATHTRRDNTDVLVGIGVAAALAAAAAGVVAYRRRRTPEDGPTP